MWPFSGYGRGRGDKKPKKRKAKKDNWFEKLTVDELKQLCTAVRVPVSGTKPALVQRLLGNVSSSEYAYEPARISWQAYARYSYDSCDDGNGPGGDKPDGPCAETIKGRVREAGLSVTGKKFDHVLRLLQHQNGVGNPKRAAGHFDDEDVFHPKKRAKSTTLPDPMKLTERVNRKVWSESKSKNWKRHAPDVMSLISKIVEQEVLEKSLVERGEAELAWEVCESIVRTVLPEKGDIFDGPVNGWGYANNCGELKSLGENLEKLASLTGQHCRAERARSLEHHAQWIADFVTLIERYGHGAPASDLDGFINAISTLRGKGQQGSSAGDTQPCSNPQVPPSCLPAAAHSPPTAVKCPPSKPLDLPALSASSQQPPLFGDAAVGGGNLQPVKIEGMCVPFGAFDRQVDK